MLSVEFIGPEYLLERFDFDKALKRFCHSPFGNNDKPHKLSIQADVFEKHIAQEVVDQGFVSDKPGVYSWPVTRVIQFLIESGVLEEVNVAFFGPTYRLEFK